MADLRDDLRAEYILIQGQYEAYDQKVLTLKGLAVPLLAAGLGIGIKDKSLILLIATVLSGLALWGLETIWKSFQYANIKRIEELETWFSNPAPPQIAPFQIFKTWGGSWNEHYRKVISMRKIAWQPFVALPYAVVVVAGAAASLILAIYPQFFGQSLPR